jgi:hypothetical protein
MAKEVRIHLTAAQKARINTGAGGENDLAVSFRQKTSDPADHLSSPAPNDSSDLHASGADLTGSGETRPTGVIRPL